MVIHMFFYLSMLIFRVTFNIFDLKFITFLLLNKSPKKLLILDYVETVPLYHHQDF